jgi:RNA polymerase sigma factor (sigma-70 family)
MEKDERVSLLRAAIDRLSVEHREVIILKNYRGLSYKEMAEELGTPIGTIMSRLYYARKALREIILSWEREGVAARERSRTNDEHSPGEDV